MDIKLENLIEKIKQEGVSEAKKMSEEITAKAKQGASSIIKNAKEEAGQIVENAKKQAKRHQDNAHSAMQQAARDLILVLKEKIQNAFDGVFKGEISKTLEPEFLKELIVKILQAWTQDKKAEVLVGEEDKKKLQDMVLSALKQKAKDNIVIKVDERISKGFRIGVEGDNVYYDFTEEGIFEALKQFVSPALAEILNRDNG